MNNNQTTTSTVLLNGEQAKQELEELRKKAAQLNKDLKEAIKMDNPEGIKRIRKELKGVEQDMKKVKVESFDAKKVLDNLSGSTLNQLKKSYAKLYAEMRDGKLDRHTKEWKEHADALKKVKAEITNVEREMNVGENPMKKYALGLKQIAGVAIVGALAAGISSWVNQILEFSKAVSQLSAITGATGKDLDYLKNKAKELGAEYGKSATEIVEAMKLVGSAKPELLANASALSDMTESVLILAKASDMELSDTTRNLATIMNQFGLSAAESNRVINTLAAGSKYGAVEVDYLGDAIGKVGAVAASAGIDLETTVAVMELFGEKGIKAEIAGTGFKSLLVELQKDTKNYTNGVFDLNKAIDNNQSIAGDNIKLTEKFGKEYFNLAQILFQGKERFIELNDQVTGTNTAFEQYAVATDNLSGDIDKLTGSWSAFILALEDGQGPIANTFRKLVQLINEAVNGMKVLSKSDKQKEKDLIALNVDSRIKNYKKNSAGVKDPLKDINAEITSERNLYAANLAKIKALKLELEENDKKNFFMHSTQMEHENKQLIADLEADINRSKAYVNALGGLKSEMNVKIKPTDNTTDDKGDDKNTKETDKTYKLAEQALESSSKRRQIIINEMYGAMNMSEYLYEQMSLNNTIETLKEKEALLKKHKKDTAAVEKEISDAKLKQMEIDVKYRESERKALQDAKKLDIPITQENEVIDIENYTVALRLKILEAFHDKGLKSEEEYQKELALLLKGNQDEINRYNYQARREKNEKQFKDGLIGEKAYVDNLRQIHSDYIDDSLGKEMQLADDISNLANAAADLSNTMQDAALQRIDNKYAKEIEAAKKAGQDTTALEEKSEEEKKQIKKKYADVDFAITVAQIIASTASAVMNALKIPPPFGEILAGIVAATGLAQVGVANQQREAIKNLWTGGFTDPGDKYAPRGIVHAGEFVGNQDATYHTPTRKVFNLIDHAQRTNTVGRITNDDIARAVGVHKGFADGGFTSPMGSPGAGGSYGITKEDLAWSINQALQGNNAVIAALAAQLQGGIKAKVSVSGNDGIAQATNTYNRYIKNASR